MCLGLSNRLVTQMYSDGERLNDTDRIIQPAGANRQRLIVGFDRKQGRAGDDTRVGAWDIVLDEG